MSDSNERWSRQSLPPFMLPSQPQKPTAAPAVEPDRSWMPTPSVAPSGISGHDWWKNGQWQKAWERPRTFAKREHPEFSRELEKLESELSALERTEHPYSSRLTPLKNQLARLYAQLNKIHDQHVKSLPLIRY